MAVFKIQTTRISLKEAQDFVGGYVELLRVTHPEFGPSQLLVADNIFDQSPDDVNLEATELCKQAGLRVQTIGVLGNALLLTGDAIWD